jgi:ABC-type Fe3+-hydroxamate transport system substrate-binding protein
VEENLRAHVETLRAWDIPVFVTYPRTVADGVRLMETLGELTGRAEAGRSIARDLGERLARQEARRAGRAPARVFCPVWRRPYMSINRDTYVHDMLAVCGGENVCAGAAARYPEITLDQVAVARPDVILLPDEPYRFRPAHAADFAAYDDMPAVRHGRVHFVEGKLLSWYGPRIAESLDVLPALLDLDRPARA